MNIISYFAGHSQRPLARKHGNDSTGKYHRFALLFSRGLCSVLVFAMLSSRPAKGGEKIVIAHRGASGYLPEHTLAAKAVAHAMGADYIEQDIVLTKDSIPVILHDIYLDTVTDVATKFSGRSRKNGRYYVVDFTLKEIRQLRVTERFGRKNGKAVFPKRFPLQKSRFTVSTLVEEIELIQGLNHSTGREVGIYPEIKSPKWHRKEGRDISKIVLSVLHEYGYNNKQDKIYLQCFDVTETKRIREELGSKLKLVQLIGNAKWKKSSPENGRLLKPGGIQELSAYVDGIGPGIADVVKISSPDEWHVTPLVKRAHEHGLEVHPYTFRKDALPKHINDFNKLFDLCYREADVDGVFTDFPDAAVRYLQQQK